jgi:hypothetical protein
MKIKKNFTLLEVIIALFLISIMLSFIFTFFSNLTKIEKNIEITKNEIYERNFLYIKLNNIFTNLKDQFFTTDENKELTFNFLYDAKVDLDPNFSSIINGKLYIDENDNLILESFSNDKKDEKRKEILFKKVKTFEVKFLSNDSDTNYLKEKISSNVNWYFFWPKEKKSIPSIIYLKINNQEYPFFISHID